MGAEGLLGDLTEVAETQGWSTALPREGAMYDGKFVGVPFNIHRANCLWSNAKVFADNGLTPPTTWDEFFAVGDTLKEKGIVPLALGGEPWQETSPLEDAMNAVGGADFYRKAFLELRRSRRGSRPRPWPAPAAPACSPAPRSPSAPNRPPPWRTAYRLGLRRALGLDLDRGEGFRDPFPRDYSLEPRTGCDDPEKAVSILFQRVGYQKRSYIRAFLTVVDKLGELLKFPQEIPRNLGLELRRRLELEPGIAAAIRDDLVDRDSRSALDELRVLRRYAGEGGDEEISRWGKADAPVSWEAQGQSHIRPAAARRNC